MSNCCAEAGHDFLEMGLTSGNKRWRKKCHSPSLNPIEEAFSTSEAIKSRLNDHDVQRDLLDAHSHIERNVNLQIYRLQVLGVAGTLLGSWETVKKIAWILQDFLLTFLLSSLTHRSTGHFLSTVEVLIWMIQNEIGFLTRRYFLCHQFAWPIMYLTDHCLKSSSFAWPLI